MANLSDVPWSLKVIIALIPLLGVAFYIGMGFEVDLANRLDEAAQEKRQRREDRRQKTTMAKKRSSTHQNVQGDNVLREINAQRQAEKLENLERVKGYLESNPLASLGDIGSHIGKGKSTAKNYTDELIQAGVIHRNGEGWKVN